METLTVNTARQNAEVVKRGYTAFNAADMKTLTDLFHINSTWHSPGNSPMAGTFKGRDAIMAHFGKIGSETAGSFKANLKNLAICDDGHIVGIQNNTATRKGKQLHADCCIVFELKDGKVFNAREFLYDLYSWDKFWS
jgi:ketosteroid isomerase-like protein